MPTSDNLAEQLGSLRRIWPILRHVPCGARRSCAEFFINILHECVVKDDSTGWTDLLLFAPQMLHAPSGKGEKTQGLATCIKKNLQDIGRAPNISSRDKPKKKQTDDAPRKAVNLKLQDVDVSGAVRLLSSEDSVAVMDADALKPLKEKHRNPPGTSCSRTAIPS